MLASVMAEEFDEELSSESDQKERERRWSEGVLRDTLRKAVEKGRAEEYPDFKHLDCLKHSNCTSHVAPSH